MRFLQRFLQPLENAMFCEQMIKCTIFSRHNRHLRITNARFTDVEPIVFSSVHISWILRCSPTKKCTIHSHTKTPYITLYAVLTQRTGGYPTKTNQCLARYPDNLFVRYITDKIPESYDKTNFSYSINSAFFKQGAYCIAVVYSVVLLFF